MNKLREIIISITNRCNLRCKMCDIPLRHSKELSTKIWKQVIEDASILRAGAIVFSGGEPLLRENIFELISFTKRKGMGVCLASNGTLINEAVAKEISSRGVDVVNISIEGEEGIHNYLRGDGTFSKALSALENLRRYGVETTVATTVSNYNYNYLPYVARLAKEYGATTVKLQPFSEIFISPNKNKDSFFMHAGDKDYLLYSIREFISLCNESGIVTNPLNYMGKMYDYLLSGRVDRRNGCDALWSSCPIDSQGNVYPCWKLTGDTHVIGNVGRSSLVDIWDSQRRKDIIGRIIKDGCPGCIMSCYDKIFDGEELDNRMSNFKSSKINERIEFILNRLYRRIRFYAFYRGSWRSIKRKLSGLFNKRVPFINVEGEGAESIEEIGKAKKMIEKELSRYERS